MLPGYLKSLPCESGTNEQVPDSTSSPIKTPSTPPPITCPSPPPSLSYANQSLSPQRSPLPDLLCTEDLSNDVELIEDFDHEECCLSPITASGDKSGHSRSSSPLSAVDIFSEFDNNVLQAIFDQAENLDSPYSILVS